MSPPLFPAFSLGYSQPSPQFPPPHLPAGNNSSLPPLGFWIDWFFVSSVIPFGELEFTLFLLFSFAENRVFPQDCVFKVSLFFSFPNVFFSLGDGTFVCFPCLFPLHVSLQLPCSFLQPHPPRASFRVSTGISRIPSFSLLLFLRPFSPPPPYTPQGSLALLCVEPAIGPGGPLEFAVFSPSVSLEIPNPGSLVRVAPPPPGFRSLPIFPYHPPGSFRHNNPSFLGPFAFLVVQCGSVAISVHFFGLFGYCLNLFFFLTSSLVLGP